MYDSLILSAGLGTRLRPLTDTIPKPLVPYFGTPLLNCALHRISQSSAGNIFINTHHLSEKISSFVDTLPTPLRERIEINFEEELLGTGGPISVVHSQNQTRDLLVYNSDCIQAINLPELYDSHKKSGCHATMALLPDCPPGKNPVYARNGRVVGIGFNPEWEADSKVTRHTLSGLHFVGSEFRDAIPKDQFFDVRETYQKFINTSRGIGAYIYSGPWFDLGEPKDYWSAHETILSEAHGLDFLELIGVTQFLDENAPKWKIGSDAAGVKFFDLSDSPIDFLGHFVLNFTATKYDLRNLSRVMIVENCDKNDFHSDRIFAGTTCFEI